MRVLVTYFAPFGTDQENASALAAKLLPNTIGAAQVITRELPVAFEEAEQELKQALCELSPDLVLCTGQAEGTAELHLERVAVNLRDARMPDNEGFAPKEMSICPEGPTAYFATIPVKRLAEELQKSGIPAAVSNSAGTYVCNDVMYTLLHALSQSAVDVLGGFIHVPLVPQQAAERTGSVPSMASGDAARGLQHIICQLLKFNTNR